MDGSVTYIGFTKEMLEEYTKVISGVAAEMTIQRLDEDDVKSIPEWARILNIDTRTLRKRVKEKNLELSWDQPERLSRKEIKKLGTA